MLLHRHSMEIENQQVQIARLLEMANMGNYHVSCKADCISERDTIFDHSGVACKMLALLKSSISPENVYQMEYLNKAYCKFKHEMPVLFSKLEFDIIT